jgi:two-component system, NtrC family, response regulator GlrR
MLHRVVIIGQDSSCVEGGLDLYQSAIERERLDWSSLDPDSLRRCHADLIVPVAMPITASVRRLFGWLRDHSIDPPTLAVIADDVDEDLLRIVSDAVDDFVVWPIRHSEFRQRVARMLRRPADTLVALRDRFVEEIGLAQLVGQDAGFLATLRQIPIIARSGRPVIVTGETGTGKELFARAIHHLSPRRSFPFVPVDCSGFPDQLFENELFGHARGAYTDAHGDHKGLVAMAEGGTLFLDEIDSLSLPLQAKLLRFLQERAYKPLGGDRFIRADVNVIAATNHHLESLVDRKAFRADLYFRLNVIRLTLAALRERRGDIPILARHFLAQTCAEAGLPHKTLTPPALRLLSLYDWPGNLRELLNVIQRAVTFADGPLIFASHVEIPGRAASGDEMHDSFRDARALVLGRFEKQYISDLLQLHQGNITHAAAAAGFDRRAFGRLMKKYRIGRQPG